MQVHKTVVATELPILVTVAKVAVLYRPTLELAAKVGPVLLY
jgi:hypothetical protein